MIYPLGTLLLIKRYKLPTEEKDKFFIVISHNGDEYNLMSMTTSQFYFSESIIRHGVINRDSGASMYCFLKNKVIGKNGFYFRKHTFINHNSNILKFTFETLSKYTIENMDCLTDDELKDLIYSFYKYKGTPKKHKEELENILREICK